MCRHQIKLPNWIQVVVAFMALLTASRIGAQESGGQQAAIVREADQLHVQVDHLVAEGKFAQALPLAQRKTMLLEQLHGRKSREIASALLWEGQIQDNLGKYDDAEQAYQESLQIALAIFGPDHPALTGCLSGLASVAIDRGNYFEAEKLYRQLIAISEKQPNRDWGNYATNLDNLALVYRFLGKYHEAEPLQLRAVAISKQVLGENQPAYAISLTNLGNLYQLEKKYPQALPLLEQAAQILERISPGTPSLADSLASLAVVQSDLENYAEAERLERRALAIREKALPADHPDIAKSLQNLATNFYRQNKFDQAAPLFERALGTLEKSFPEHPYLASTLMNLANIRQEQGNFAQAQQLYDRAIKIFEKSMGPDSPDVACCLENAVTILTSQHRWQEAAEVLDRQRRIVRRHVDRVLPGLSAQQQLIYLILSDNAPWATGLTLGLEQGTTPNIASYSAEWLLNSKAIAQESLTRNACLLQGNNDPQVNKIFANLLAVRRQLAALMASDSTNGSPSDQHETIEQLQATEQQLSRDLAQATGRTFPEDPWVKLSDIRPSIPADGVLVTIARFDVHNFEAKSRSDFWKPAHYVAWIVPPAEHGEVKVVDLGEASPIDDAVEDFEHAMQAAMGIGDKKSLISELGEQQAEAEIQKPLASLARRVWEPLTQAIGDDTKQLLLSPDGMLWLAPWGALPIEDGKFAIEKYRLRYLISGRELAPSNVVLKKSAQPVIFADPDYDLGTSQVEAATRRVLRGAPTMNAELRSLVAGKSATKLPRVGRLKGTAVEAAAIKPTLKQYAGQEPITYVDQYATEGVFKALHRPQVLVLSTHGYFLSEQPVSPHKPLAASESDPRATQALRVVDGQLIENPLLRCGLLLAGCNSSTVATPSSRPSPARGEGDTAEDGVLTGMEISATDLRGTELVVLSACETAVGAVQAGEGVSGLRQAFELAGAKSVVATLWQIPDKDSAELVSHFFENLSNGQPKDEALRNAQLAQIETHRQRFGAAHPFYWAAFTITGE